MKDKLLSLLLALCSTFFISSASAQCAYLNNSGATAAIGACPATTSASINPGQYVSVNVVAGNSYTFSVCGNTTCDTQITLFGVGGVTNYGYNDDDCGLQSSITWVATFTGTVELQLNTYNCGSTGGTCNNTTVDISCTAGGGGAAPGNDDPCGATALGVGAACTFSTYDNTGATPTVTPVIPAPGCASYGGNDVWFTATVPASGGLEIDMNTGSLTDMGMAVYTAPSCSGTFTLVGCDDDGSANGLMPYMQVNLPAGTVVYIRVWDYGGNSEGTFDICAFEYTPTVITGCNGNPAAGDICTLATPICSLNGYCGNTSSQYSASSVTPFCGSIENNSWLTFTADATTVNLTVDVSNCTSGSGVQFALYSTTNCTSFTYATGAAGTSCYSPVDGLGNSITFPNLIVGNTYVLMVDGYAGAVCDYQITANTGVSVGVDVGSDVTLCAGQSATLTATGGNGSYVWNSGQTTSSITVTPAVTTTYIANSTTGSANCPQNVADTVVVFVNPIPTVTVSPNISICAGGTGTSLTAGGATTYSWSPATGLSSTTGGTVTANPPSTTTYTVTGTSNGCTNTATVTVTVTPPPVIAINPAAPTICYGDNTTLTASGATTYTWSPATGLSGTTGATVTANPTTTTTYTVTGTSAGCPNQTATVTVTVSPQIVPNFTIAGNQCFATQSIALTNSGTAGTYSWAFTGGPGNQTGSPVSVTWPTAGTYDVTLTTTVGTCVESITQSVTIYADPTVTANSTDVSCAGANDGTITANSASAGTYSWNSGQSGAGPHNVGPGTYTVTFTDLNGCSATAVTTVTEPPVLTASTSSSDASCSGVCDGDVDGSAAGGTSPYTYTWNNGLGAGQNQTLVCAGTYTLTVTDANGCTATATATVSEPAPVTVSTSSVNASCAGVCDGDLGAIGAGGTGPYTYSWDNGIGAGQNHNGTICAGTYTVTVTDVNGCTVTGNATVSEPPLLTASANGTDADCNGVASGSLTASGASGTGPYTYNWDNGLGAGANHNGVSAGTYNVTVTDANGCTAIASFTINEPTLLTATIAGTHASCNGICDGSATATPAGGTSPYTYQWDAGGGLATTATASNLCAGTANVTITDANGCVETGSFVITEPIVLTANATSSDASCNGVCDGSVGATSAGGTGALTYTWDNGLGAGQNINGVVCAGTYNVTVTDANGCTATASATVSEPTAVTVVASNIDASCNGVCDGSVTGVGAGGTSPYTYSWDGGLGAGQSQNGIVCAGTYNVTVTDANGCTVVGTATVGEPTPVTVSTTNAAASCNGVCDGSVSATGAGGTGPYTYAWDNGLGAGSNQTGIVCAGTYNITVTDANGCTAIGTATVTEPTLLTVAMAGTDASCNGICDGDATATPAGGTPPYTYQWDAGGGFATTQTATGLCAGTPNVTITDANGCTVVGTLTVDEPTAITSGMATTPATCGNPDGSATVTAAGGTSPYSYLWDAAAGNQTTATATGLLAGGYTVTITDANGCVSTATATVNDAGAPSASITASSDVSCNGGNDGSATVNPIGGTSPYVILWSPLGGTGLTATGLPAGAYTVTVTDANGCVATTSVTINEPALFTSAITASTNATCNGICDASATVSANGGVSPYTYSWNNGAGTNPSATGLCAGLTYTVTITDANGCAIQSTFTPTEPALLTAAIAGTDASCDGICDGSADLTASGGTTPYSYSWTTGDNSEDITGTLCAGTHDVTVTDANGCVAVASVTIGEPTAIVLTPSSVNSNCGAADGQACIAATGGTSPYTYLWDDGATQTTTCALAVPSGTYNVTVTDANGCVAVVAVSVNDNSGGVASASVDNNASCAGICDGAATASMAGGTSPFTYLWSSGGVAASEVGLCAGVHTVDITDANGCTSSTSVTITEPTILAGAFISTNPASCNGICDGDATISASGGTTPYSYSWTSGGVAAAEFGLCAGNVDVTITDANGCTITLSTIINEPAALTASTVGVDASCDGICDGSADLTVGGGTTPYSYNWDNGDTSEDPAGLCAGTYNVTVTDANGCTITSSITINEPTPVTTATSSLDANCGQADGEACVIPSGGTPPYTYLWNNGQTTDCATNVASGTYTVTVTDANGCTAVASVTVNDIPGGTAATVVNNNVTISGGSNGSATVNMTGGTSPFTYLWDAAAGNQTTATATNLSAGTFCVDVTDANGCIATACVTITEPGALIVNGTTIDLLCNGVCSGEIDVTVSGGVSPYTYAWNTSATAEDLTNQCAGSYTVTVTDANGATGTASFTLIEPTALAITNTTIVDVNCNGLCDGSADVLVAGGTTPYSYNWIDDSNGAAMGSNFNLTNLCAGSYSVTVTDANGCTTTATAVITEPTPIALMTSSTNSNCGQADGSVSVIASGGTGTYISYDWFDATPALVGSTPTVNSLPSGTYTVTVTDDNGCPQTATVSINDNTAGIGTTAINNNVSCFGICDGSATATLVGGTSPYTYSWNSGTNPTDQTVTGLCAGTWTVDITDATGCVSTATVTIVEPAPLTISTSAVDVTCFGLSDGSVTVTPNGGTAGYSYNWIDNATAASVGTTFNVTGLPAGNYTVTVVDANGCSASANQLIGEPSAIVLVPSSTDASCGQSDGTASVTAAGGSGTFVSFDWIDDATGASAGSGNSIGGIPAGGYTVTVTDNTGCTASAIVVVGNLTGPTGSIVSTTDVSCAGLADGSATVSGSGGTGALTYTWVPGGLTGTTQTGLSAQTYTVTIADANGCTDVITVTINEPAVLTANISAITNVSGFGLCDGDLTINVAGGTTPYSYQWYDDNTYTNPIPGAATASNLCAQEYCVIVTDANGCTISLCGTVGSPNAITGTLTGTDETCFGACDGTSSLVPSGGVSPYTYQWFSGTPPGVSLAGYTSTNAINLCPGTYFVVITDGNGISGNSEIITIGGPTEITGTTSVVSNFNGAQISCFGQCDGSAQVIPSGGTAPFSFQWLDATNIPIGQTGSIASNLCAGTYNVVITDVNGCDDTLDITLTEPAALGNALVEIDASCYGTSDGSISTAVFGGTTPYSYLWNNGAASTTSSITNEIAGTYSVIITDVNGCTITETGTINEPTEMLLGGTNTGSTCGQADGSATASIISGDGPFTYMWDINASSQTTPTATNLTSGCYDCIVTDINGCTETVNVCVLDLGSPTVSILTQTDATCNSTCDGFAQLQVSGGTPPYTFQWLDNTGVPIGQTTASAFGLCAGTYTGQITDVSGCIASVNVTINEPTQLNVSLASSSDVSCFGICDGDATILATGGTTPYTYLWNDPLGQTTATATSLCPGTYTVSVTDGNNCNNTLTVTIGEPAQLIASATAVDAFCNLPLGTATASVASGGVAPFSYMWSDGQSGTTAVGLVPGNYDVTITDVNGCTGTSSVTVGNVPAGVATISNIVNVSCFGSTDGSATASMGGTGTPPFTYGWFDGSNAPIGQTSQTATGLNAGDYFVIVTDANGCIDSSALSTVSEPTILTVATTSFDASCAGTCDGSISTTAAGGTMPYSYLWNDPLNQTTITAQNLCAGSFDVTLTDVNGCTATLTSTVVEPAPLALDSIVTNANCGQADGQGCVLASGGIAPYTYSWPNGNTNSCEINLVAGTYLVTVTDANGCSAVIPVEVQDMNGPVAGIIAQADVSCNAGCDGTATVDMVGGAGATFTVLWDATAGGQTTPTATNLCAGTYTVTITDDIGCSASTNVTVGEPNAIATNPQSASPSCSGLCDGGAWITVVGGTTPYTYSWLDAQTGGTIGGNTDSLGNLCDGDYILTVTDANGCIEFINYTITQPLGVTGTTSTTPTSCAGLCDGTATAMGGTGFLPFSYQWDLNANAQTTPTATGLCAGTYTVSIIDGNGCLTNVTATVTEPPVLTATITTFGNVSCASNCDGFAQVDVAGGNGTYFYQWSNGAGISQVAPNLCAGQYDVTVTDQNGCTATASVTILEPNPMSVNHIAGNVTCYDACNGSAIVQVSGGTAPFSYQWSGNGVFVSTPAALNLCAGTYNVLVTDANGCQISETIVITQPAALLANATLTNSNCGQNNGAICVNVFGGQFPYTYQWNDPNTQTGACANNLLAGCYNLVITDGNGCTLDTLFCINDIAGPTVSFVSSTDVTCFGNANGSITMDVTGGVQPYASLTWQDGGGNPLPQFDGLVSINGLSGGCYALTAVDAAGCIASLQACIVEPTQVTTAIIASTNASCNGFCDGSATVSEFGGVGGYTYSWSDGQTTPTASNLCAGNYVVTVTDANGCSSQSTIVITEPTPMLLSIASQTDASCFGFCDGSVTGMATGSTAPYLYTWQPSGGSSPTATNLCAGNYRMKVQDANGCIDSIAVIINEPTELIVSGIAVDATCTQSNGTGSVTANGGTSPYVYNWGGVGSTPNSSANSGLPIGIHTIFVSDANGCMKQVDLTVNDQPGPIIDSIIFVAPTCFGLSNGSATVYATSPIGSNLNYIWDAAAANQNAQTAVALGAGVYCVTVTDVNGCTTTQCVSVTEPALLVPVPDIPRTICYGDSTQIWANAQGGTAPYNYTWNTAPVLIGGGPHTVEPTFTTDYCFTVTDARGCVSPQGCVTITVTPELLVSLTPPASICDGDAITLTATSTGGNGDPLTFEWYEGTYPGPIVQLDFGVTTSDLTVNPSLDTWYYVLLSDGCSVDALDSVLVSINATPIGFLNVADSSGCAPFTADFTANTDIGVVFDWDFDCDGVIDLSGSNSTPSYTYSTPGVYTVCLTITSADGCFISLQEVDLIEVFDVPTAGFVPSPDVTTILNPTIDFIDQSTGATIWDWDFGDGTPNLNGPDGIIYDSNGDSIYTVSNPSHTYQDTGLFVVTQTVFNQYGCSDQVSHTVHVEGDYILFAPTAFTPNGDGKNDVFFPLGIGFDNRNYEMYIFDRWGEIVFESHDATKGWDGTIKNSGVMAKLDVYVWMIKTVDHNGDGHQYYGHVTCVR